MEKNIAALLREDARTVHVRYLDDSTEGNELASAVRGNSKLPQFSTSARTYTYVTDMPLKEGQLVIVPANRVIKLARVAHIDEDVKISDIQYAWVIDMVNEDAHNENMSRNHEIEKTVAEAYRNNLRRGFAQQLLAGVDDARREQLTKLIAAPTTV